MKGRDKAVMLHTLFLPSLPLFIYENSPFPAISLKKPRNILAVQRKIPNFVPKY